MKNGDNNQEVLPPVDDPDGPGPVRFNLVPGKNPDLVKLTTPGQVKAEMGRIYRAKLKGRVNSFIADSLIRNNLLPILKATEIEQAFNLAQDDPDADRPALMGLTILGPGVELPAGTPARRLDGPDIPTTREDKTDDKTDGKPTKT